MLGTKEIKINLNGKVINIETGKIAKQSAGSTVVTCEGTIVLVTRLWLLVRELSCW